MYNTTFHNAISNRYKQTTNFQLMAVHGMYWSCKQGTNEYKRKTEQIWALVCTIYEFVLHFILQATRQKSDEQIAFKNSHQHEKK